MFRTIQAAASALREGQLTPIHLLEQCLQQVEKYEETVRAWVFVDKDSAREQAEKSGAELKAGHDRGPLHGIPLGIKDIIDVFDWPTAAGSELWRASIARRDATVVQKLRQAGAVFVGKTVTTQYASFDPPPTRNPWNLQRTPGGSSSGSAAAVATGMCLGALSSQTGGSTTRPAAYCGVPSCKPTFGRVSTQGVVPLASSMDHIGPIARCVWDLAVLLETIAGEDWEDDATLRAEHSYLDLKAGLETAPPPRIGRLTGMFDDLAEPPVRAMMIDVVIAFRTGGATVEETRLPPSFTEVLKRHRIIMAVEAAAFHETRLKRHPTDYLPNIGKLLREGLACPAPEYARCKEHQQAMRDDAVHWFSNVDVLMTPATTGPAPDKATTGDPAFNSPWSYTGLPAVSLPAGKAPDGLPLSIQLIGRPFGERELLAAASWCERMLSQPLDEPPIWTAAGSKSKN
jgi:aspartyl-tRNA(Asn)/glutamyl-tRNA(Gln) amidotransferase subunit A